MKRAVRRVEYPRVTCALFAVIALGCSDDGGGDGNAGGTNAGGSASSGAPSGGRPAAGAPATDGGMDSMPSGGAAGGGGRNAGGSGGGAPAPASKWVNVTGSLAGVESDCGNLTLMRAEPGTSRVLAAVAIAGIYESTDLGKTWTKLAGSGELNHGTSSIVFDPDHAGTFWESGTYGDAGVFRTTNGGDTFTQLGDISHNDLVSVDFTDPERKTLLAGGHEQARTLYLSTDGGENFTNIGANLPADSNFSSAPLVLDAESFLVGACGWGDGACGIFASENGGKSWTTASELPAINQPLVASDGAIYWFLADDGLAKSTDAGKSFDRVSNEGWGNSPVELPDGRIVVLGDERLMASKDGGESFAPIGEPLPYTPHGVTYSGASKAFFIWRNDCQDFVPDDAIMSAGFDYTTQ